MGHFLQVGLSLPNLQWSSLSLAYISNSWQAGHRLELPSFFWQYKRTICSTTFFSSSIRFTIILLYYLVCDDAISTIMLLTDSPKAPQSSISYFTNIRKVESSTLRILEMRRIYNGHLTKVESKCISFWSTQHNSLM